MELTERIETLNKRLSDTYGTDTITGRPIYRIVWSEDQFEKRLSKFSPAGIETLEPQVYEFPKYKQWTHGPKFILERLAYVPIEDNNELKQMTVNKISYEPLWVFMDNQFNALPPKWEVCQIVIDTVHAAIHRTGDLAKYAKDEGWDAGTLERQQERVSKLQEELFGNETLVGDALAHKEGVIVPRNFEKEKVM